MKTLTGCMGMTAAFWLVATAAPAAEPCMAPAPELEQMEQKAALDEVTRGKIDSLLHDAAGLCEEGDTEKAQTKFVNVRQLLDSEVPGQVAPKRAPDAAPNTTPEISPTLKRDRESHG
jgi:hypothetical protein